MSGTSRDRTVTFPLDLAEQAASIIEEQIGAASDIPDAIRKLIREQVPHPVALDLRDLRIAIESGTVRDLLDRLEAEPDLHEVIGGSRDPRVRELIDRVEGHGNEADQ